MDLGKYDPFALLKQDLSESAIKEKGGEELVKFMKTSKAIQDEMLPILEKYQDSLEAVSAALQFIQISINKVAYAKEEDVSSFYDLTKKKGIHMFRALLQQKQ